MTVSFMVSGIPAPQGSKIRTRYGMRESSQRVKPWRDAVASAVRKMEHVAPPYDIDVHFFIPRTKTTDAAYPVAPSIGDIDKLLRSTYDALKQGGLITDDRFIVKGTHEKSWAGLLGPGAVISVRQVES